MLVLLLADVEEEEVFVPVGMCFLSAPTPPPPIRVFRPETFSLSSSLSPASVPVLALFVIVYGLCTNLIIVGFVVTTDVCVLASLVTNTFVSPDTLPRTPTHFSVDLFDVPLFPAVIEQFKFKLAPESFPFTLNRLLEPAEEDTLQSLVMVETGISLNSIDAVRLVACGTILLANDLDDRLRDIS